ncbi:YbfB/YjiJ family MFS transporter [Azomonas macrocytogenes]|uniref:Putative MFS family arabinose efflux permease n=1 Tax=Azomonas macrocytogenes TaxID=69962 RepID=A0A839T3A2_AZOMA|nr:YbfB/YjiJ family MFS transporter [Azomonas macrocytogenes]MBB3102213.1 putative MFS family arabinose efflux permease [Azomonas macrocytogenes]
MSIEQRSSSSQESVWPYIFAGLCASLISIGLARFAYTPLIPSLIQSGWFTQYEVVYLSAANLAGYLIGALIGNPIAYRISNTRALKLMLGLVTLSFFACAYPLSITWFFSWRLLSGIAGGAVMVLVASAILPHIAPAKRGAASGAIFLGIGVGIAGSGTVVPALLSQGLQNTWLGLGAIALVLTLASWKAWPTGHTDSSPTTLADGSNTEVQSSGLKLLFAQYALMAAGLVPAMVFLVDYVERGLGFSHHAAAIIWSMYGVGAMLGPVVYGMAADKLGPQKGVRTALLIQAAAVALLCGTNNSVMLGGLAIVIGSFPAGIVPLALARVHQLRTTHFHQRLAWSRATISFATFQAVAAVGYSMIFSATHGSYQALFTIATAVLLAALFLEPVASKLNRSRSFGG